MINQYEVMFLFTTNEAIFQSSLETVKKIFTEQNVEIESENDMGVRELAYEVKKAKDAHYYLFHIKVESTSLKTLTKEIQLHEEIPRFLFVKKVFKKDRYAKKRA